MLIAKRASLTAASVVAIACPALATITVGVDVTTSGGSVANALNVTTTNIWTGAGLFVELSQGSVINLGSGLGGVDTAPTQLEIDANPSLLFDTYVGRVGASDNPSGGAVDVGGADPFDLGPAGISATWVMGFSVGAPISNVSVGNFVFSDDAAGVWSLGITESLNAQARFIGGTLAGGELLTDFVPGDLNVDNFTGIGDLNLVLGHWNTDGSADPRSDPTGDHFVGIEDLNEVLGGWNAGTPQGPWSYNPVGLPGDLNGDGFVGIDDLGLILVNWHQNVTAGDDLSGDPSGDGFVSLDDMNILLTFWQTGTPPIAVPEPAGVVLLSLGTLALLRRCG
jgi:hypothetical protein